MRGDQKWPPADVKKQSELENEERRKLAQQPAFRPRKVQKVSTHSKAVFVLCRHRLPNLNVSPKKPVYLNFQSHIHIQDIITYDPEVNPQTPKTLPLVSINMDYTPVLIRVG